VPLSPAEAVVLAEEVAELVAFLNKALRKDDDGKVRLNPDETKEMLRRLAQLTAHVTRDLLD
jgi:hypothetical protein